MLFLSGRFLNIFVGCCRVQALSAAKSEAAAEAARHEQELERAKARINDLEAELAQCVICSVVCRCDCDATSHAVCVWLSLSVRVCVCVCVCASVCVFFFGQA